MQPSGLESLVLDELHRRKFLTALYYEGDAVSIRLRALIDVGGPLVGLCGLGWREQGSARVEIEEIRYRGHRRQSARVDDDGTCQGRVTVEGLEVEVGFVISQTCVGHRDGNARRRRRFRGSLAVAVQAGALYLRGRFGSDGPKFYPPRFDLDPRCLDLRLRLGGMPESQARLYDDLLRVDSVKRRLLDFLNEGMLDALETFRETVLCAA